LAGVEAHPDARQRAVAARWDGEAATYDQQFDHQPRSPVERAAWDRVLHLIDGGRRGLDVLDVGTGTGFLALELATRGHRVTGIDLSTAMLDRARRHASARSLPVTFLPGDAERPPFPATTFDLLVSRHVLWSLSNPGAAVGTWRRLLRPGGRVAVVDGEWGTTPPAPGGGPPSLTAGAVRELLAAQGCVAVAVDHLEDLRAALEGRMEREGLPVVRHPRYLVWGDIPG
jgi:ubiquinone/menaquinone biosynthesis C-methylase UbiE